MGREGKDGPFWRSAGGSLTIEALLIFPLILLLMALFLRWGLTLGKELREAGDMGRGTAVSKTVPPARRIRDVDGYLDLAYKVKGMLPSWSQAISNRVE